MSIILPAELNDEAQKKAKQEAKAASEFEIAKLKSALNRDRDEYNRKIDLLLQGKSWEDVERIGTRGGYLQGCYEAKMQSLPDASPDEQRHILRALIDSMKINKTGGVTVRFCLSMVRAVITDSAPNGHIPVF